MILSAHYARRYSTVKLLLADKEAAQKRKYDNANHKREPFVRCPAIRAANNLGDCRIEGFDVVETLSHSVHDLVDVFAVVQRRPQSSSEELLDHCGGQREPDY